MIENHRSLHEKIRDIKEWKTKITLISDEWKITDPANPDFIEQIEHKFHIRIPEELLNLYNETNAVKDQYCYDIIFPVQDLLKRNQEMRNDDGFKSLYMPFDHLLFIGEYGNGDLFGYPISMKGKIKKRSIFIWNHENDSREWAAMSIVDLFIRAICGFFD